MSFSWGWPTIAYIEYQQRKERIAMSYTTDGNEPQAIPPKKKSKKWLWITIGILLLIILTRPGGGSSHDPKATPVGSPSPAVATAPAPAPAQQSVPAPVAPVVQPETITFTEGDYEVGNGEGQIKPGKYKTTGGNGIFKFSTWTIYDDFDRKNMMAFGSVGDGPGIMTVPKNAKMVSFSGSAEWIKSK